MIAYGKWETTFRWLVGLYAAALLLSISAMDLLHTLIILATIALALISKRSQRPKVFVRLGPDWLILGFIVTVVIGLALNISQGASLAVGLKDLNWVLVLYAVAAAVRIAEPTERSLAPAALILIAVSIYSIGISVFGFEPLGGVTKIHRAGEIIRTGGPLLSPMTLAHSYGQIFALVAGLFFVYFQSQRRAWILLGITAFLLGLTLIFTFTRGVWVGIAAAVLVMAFLRGKKFGSLILAVGVVAILAAVMGSSTIRGRLTQVFDPSRSYDNNRYALWQGNWEMWKDNPVFGVGYGENSDRVLKYLMELGYPETQYTSHAHNQYLQILGGTGIVGFILFYGMIFGFYAMALRNYYRLPETASWQKGLMLGCIGAMTCFLIGGITEANFSDSEVAQVWCFTVALVVWVHYDLRGRKEIKSELNS